MSREEKEIRLVPVGKIVRTHGVRGMVKIYAFGETLAGMSAGERLLLDRSEPRRSLTLIGLKPQGKVWIGEFKELTTMDAAQAVIGEELLVPEDHLPATEEGEYYHYQLIGLSVLTRDGQRLGTLQGIIETGGNDVYVVTSHGREVLVPAIEDVICEVDLDRGQMVIDPPEGLLDDI